VDEKPESKIELARRNLLKAALTAGAAAAAAKALPKDWVRPVVNSVDVPVHAAASGCLIYGATGVTAVGFGPDETAIICATVCGSNATATFQTVFSSGSTDRRTGSFVNGSGTMTLTAFAPGCNTGGPRATTLTNITGSSLTYTMQRGEQGPVVAVLPVLGACPSFPALTGSC
jgi:hypothetical protein